MRTRRHAPRLPGTRRLPGTLEGKTETSHVSDMWTLPGALMWVPTTVNGYLLAEILQLWWQRRQGGYNTAQGDFEIWMHIMAASVPIAGLLLIGAGVFAVMGRTVGTSFVLARTPGVRTLLALNISAPILLYFALRFAT